MKILALDTSTRCTGWSYYQDGNMIASGIIDLKKSKEDANDRVVTMCKSILSLIDKYSPDIVGVEELHVSRNMVTAKSLMRIIDAIYTVSILENRFLFREVHPSTWRKAVGIKGKREDVKAQSIEFVKNTYNKDVSDDEADAICIGYCLSIEETK